MLNKSVIERHVAHTSSKTTRGFLKNHKITAEVVFEKGLSNWLDDMIAKEYPKSKERVSERKTPTNYVETYVNKVSNTHAVEPSYYLQNKKSSKDLNDKLKDCEWHNKMISAQNVLNAHCCLYAEPYTSDSITGPSVRIYRGSEFEAYSNPSSNEPNVPDAIIKYLGVFNDSKGDYALRESVDKDDIARYKVRNGILDQDSLVIRENPMGEIPGQYTQLSLFGLKGDPDVELLLLTKVYNTNIADLNFTFKYMNHPARIAKNMQLPEGENLDFNVDTIIEAKTRRSDNKEPTIETIFTEVDYESGFDYNQKSVIAFFLARGAKLKIEQPNERPMATGTVDMEMFDLTAIWEKQKTLFGSFENKLLRKFIKYNNLYKGDFEDKSELPEDGKLKISYADSRDFTAKSTRLDNAKKENDLGITTKEKMIRDVNPQFEEPEVQALLLATQKEDDEEQPSEEDGQENTTEQEVNDGNA